MKDLIFWGFILACLILYGIIQKLISNATKRRTENTDGEGI